MIKAKHWLSVLSYTLIMSAISTVGYATSAYGVSLINTLSIPGETTDLENGNGANVNRFGFFSDLYYDRFNNVYYALGDRPLGGCSAPSRSWWRCHIL